MAQWDSHRPVAVSPTKGQPLWEYLLKHCLFSIVHALEQQWVTAAQACCSLKVVLFMLVQAFLVPEDDLSFPVPPPQKPCKCGILLQRERWELLLLSYTMTTQKTAEKGRMGEVSLIKRKICDYIEDYLQVLPMWCLLASSCPFTFLAIFTFCFEYVRLSLSNWNF